MSSRVVDRRYGDPRAGERILRSVQTDHGLRAEVDIASDDLTAIVAKIRSKKALSRKELIDATYGLAIELPDGERLIDESAATRHVLEQVEALHDRPRRFRRAYGGLLNSYFMYRPNSGSQLKTWNELRAWLNSHLGKLDPSVDEVAALVAHRNLLTEAPCDRYVRNGLSDADVDDMRGELGLPVNSWVFGEIFLAQTRHACQLSDKKFVGAVPALLNRAKAFPAYLSLVVAALLDRYADASFAAQEHEDLQVEAIALWGNPLDKGTHAAWNAVDKGTRRMVEGWVTRKVIDLFFGVISKKWSTDRRRSDFWLQYADDIEDFHLFLGDDIYYSRAAENVELRDFLRGKFLRMNGDGDNNGFLMVIKGVGFVEFSNHSNACYVYDARDLPFSTEGRSLDINALKHKSRNIDRLIHRGNWEWVFRFAIKRHTGVGK